MALPRVARHCNFSNLEEALRDWLVCGLWDERIQWRLLAKKDPMFQVAMDEALATEAADQFIAEVRLLPSPPVSRRPTTTVPYVESADEVEEVLQLPRPTRHASCLTTTPPQAAITTPCASCGELHERRNCQFRDAQCWNCGKLPLDPTVRPIRLKARRVPFALKPKIEAELDRLTAQGVLEPVDYAPWETPIVTPLKPNGEVRICADYKCTINRALQDNPYPVPVVSHVLAALTAEAQTIVTHRGAFRVRRLQFGVSVAPGIFQSIMDALLKGIPGVQPFFDDVLVAAPDPEEFGNRLTDHKPLLGLLAPDRQPPQILSQRVLRWNQFLNSYTYTLEHRAGKAMGYADALSRLPLPEMGPDPAPAHQVMLMESLPEPPLHAAEVAKATQKHKTLARVLDWVVRGWPEGNMGEEFKPYKVRREELAAHKGCLLWGSRVVIPPPLQRRVLESLHETHPGIVRMKALARSYVWWPGMDGEIESWVRRCQTCQESRPEPPSAPATRWESTRKPWSRLHLDFAGPFQGQIFMIIVDAYTKWLEVIPVGSTSSAAAIRALRRVLSTHGIPDTIVSDNGTAFTSADFQAFLQRYLIRHIRSAPFHPATNGQAERMVRTTKEALGRIVQGDWDHRLAAFLFDNRITPNPVTGVSPAELLMGR
ncbi:uncharacterized protein K02A2.6-like, partial [Heteronotia binoei]|uniref:uncharacterized protein K02A2.6-like n=2 Tax=Heteronotia binoei TaxID=13085 RepID=UPI002930DA4F